MEQYENNSIGNSITRNEKKGGFLYQPITKATFLQLKIKNKMIAKNKNGKNSIM